MIRNFGLRYSIYYFRKKIISIDGGNHVCKGGQINFIILESLNTMNFSYIYVDHYEKYEMKEDVFYEKPKNRVNITFVDNEVELVDKDLDFSFIRHKKTNQFMWVHNSSLYQDKGTLKYYAYDATNEFLGNYTSKAKYTFSIVISARSQDDTTTTTTTN